jgi:hypothetical protein
VLGAAEIALAPKMVDAGSGIHQTTLSPGHVRFGGGV